MRFDPKRADIRFGCGVSPSIAPPNSVDQMLERLSGLDHAGEKFPIPAFDVILKTTQKVRKADRMRRKGTTEAARNDAAKQKRKVVGDVRRQGMKWFGHLLLRRARTQDGLRERLAFFWADHFTAVGKAGAWRFGHEPYVETAIRPHITGRFSDMLRAVATHPMMLHYLDQRVSVGPNSKAAGRKKRLTGLNENLAREMLELHTLGVNGPYTQGDVRQLAELLTGVTFDQKTGFRFRPAFSEPGAETVLGRDYGGGRAHINDVFRAIDDLARHLETGRHIARKLAMHFISDQPDASIINVMADRFNETGGDLMQVYRAMLEHPSAWEPTARNVKQPIDYMGSALRALDIKPRHMPLGKPAKLVNGFLTPLALMGQEWGRPLGPDGWPEADDAWITPQRLAARLQWGMMAPTLLRRKLPDPREFVQMVLDDEVPGPLQFATAAAESRAEGIAIVLASPAFQRM